MVLEDVKSQKKVRFFGTCDGVPLNPFRTLTMIRDGAVKVCKC
jgi:hypothetical protein